MHEVTFEPDYQNDYDAFRAMLPPHIGNELDDAIGWALLEDPKGIGDQINGSSTYVWKKPSQLNCPEFYIVYEVSDNPNKVSVAKFLPLLAVTAPITQPVPSFP